MIKCGADERRPLRLDAAEPLFLHCKNVNESPQVHHRTQIRTFHIVRNVFAIIVKIPDGS